MEADVEPVSYHMVSTNAFEAPSTVRLTVFRLFGLVVYFLIASFSYLFIFDHATFTHPKYLKNQIRLEIHQALSALPVMAIFTTPFFVGEVRGYAKLYDAFSDAPFSMYNVLQFPFFIGFTDCFVYCAHRSLHHPYLYRRFHKPHHKWLVPTPFASHAFHPVDGFMQSLPYHVFPFLFPLQKFVYIVLFVFINIWTVFIRKSLPPRCRVVFIKHTLRKD